MLLTLLSMALIVPGLVVAYAFLLRPILHRVPKLKAFYDEADGFWAKVWALCGKSVTVLWGLIVAAVGSAFSLLTPLATALGDPDLKAQVTTALANHPDIAGDVTIGFAVITILARFRTLGA